MFTNPFSFLSSSGNTPDYLLDTYSGSTFAYSFRKLSSTYTGDSFRLRRESDNAEIDVGFADRYLDQPAIIAFCTGTTGYVTTWYDQSGNSNNAEQPVTTDQPVIYYFGSIVQIGATTKSYPAMYTADGFVKGTTGVFTGATGATIYSINLTSANGGGFWDFNDSLGGATHHPWVDGNVYEGFGSNGRIGTSSLGLFNSVHVYNVMSRAGQYTINVNNSNLYSSSTNTVYFPATYEIGRSATAAYPYDGYYQEVVLWNYDNLSDATGIYTNMNNFYKIT